MYHLYHHPLPGQETVYVNPPTMHRAVATPADGANPSDSEMDRNESASAPEPDLSVSGNPAAASEDPGAEPPVLDSGPDPVEVTRDEELRLDPATPPDAQGTRRKRSR